MIAKEMDYNELYGNISSDFNEAVAAKCRCVACNSCSCGKCRSCIGQCTGCKSSMFDEEIGWEVV